VDIFDKAVSELKKLLQRGALPRFLAHQGGGSANAVVPVAHGP
jgi:hypothetical protein